VIKIRVYGTPAPQGSKRGYPVRKGGRVVGYNIVEQNKEPVKAWRDSVVAAALLCQSADGVLPILGPVQVSVVFYMRRPKSHYGTGRNETDLKESAPRVPETAPDWDKLARSTMDALTTAGIWRDDCQVWRADIIKLYAKGGRQPGADILITSGGLGMDSLVAILSARSDLLDALGVSDD
jgi:Holliday junction resolvase RusA-like endonuclease